MKPTPIRGPDGLYRTMVRVDGEPCVRVLGPTLPPEHADGSVDVDLSDLECSTGAPPGVAGLSDLEEFEPDFTYAHVLPVQSRTITPRIDPNTLLALLERERFAKGTGK